MNQTAQTPEGRAIAQLIRTSLEKAQGRAAEKGAAKGLNSWIEDESERLARDLAAPSSGDSRLMLVIRAMDSSSDAIGICDPEGRHVFQNPAFTRLFGYTSEEINKRGGPRICYTDEDTAEDVFGNVRAGRSWTGEIDMRSKSGRTFPVYLKADAIRESDGTIVGLIGIHEDITVRRAMEEELKEKKTELLVQSRQQAEVNQALRELLSQSQDEMKKLERRIVGNVDDLVFPYVKRLLDTELNVDQRVYVNVIEQNLSEILTPFMQKIGTRHSNLTPREIEVANFVRMGATSKEIAKALSISKRAVEFHRDSLRKKLGLKKTKKNLRSYLAAL